MKRFAIIAVCTGAVIGLAACGGGAKGATQRSTSSPRSSAAHPDSGTPSPAPTATRTRCGVVGAMCPVDNGDTGGYPPPASTTADLRAGPVTVLTAANDTRYDTTVTFMVRNTSAANVSARYRITLFAGGKPIAWTDGSDTVAVAGRAKKPVVLALGEVGPDGVQPDAAAVSLEQTTTHETLPATRTLRLSGSRFDCSAAVHCAAAADLIYTGHVPIRIASVDVQLVDKTGTIRGAGSLTAANDRLLPGRTPLTGRILCPACSSGAVDAAGLTVNFAVEPAR